jgi:hypothetical protein
VGDSCSLPNGSTDLGVNCTFLRTAVAAAFRRFICATRHGRVVIGSGGYVPALPVPQQKARFWACICGVGWSCVKASKICKLRHPARPCSMTSGIGQDGGAAVQLGIVLKPELTGIVKAEARSSASSRRNGRPLCPARHGMLVCAATSRGQEGSVNAHPTQGSASEILQAPSQNMRARSA